MVLSKAARISLVLLLLLLYHVILALVALLNTAVWSTELPDLHSYHQPGLYAVVKGFNAFFGVICLATIVVVVYNIGNYILTIADLRIRANYNFYLFICSLAAVILIPMGYVLMARYFWSLFVSERFTDFFSLVLMCFVAIDACIIFVLAIFLMLTSLLSTLRSYNTFRHLIRIRDERKRRRESANTVPSTLKPPRASGAAERGTRGRIYSRRYPGVVRMPHMIPPQYRLNPAMMQYYGSQRGGRRLTGSTLTGASGCYSPAISLTSSSSSRPIPYMV